MPRGRGKKMLIFSKILNFEFGYLFFLLSHSEFAFHLPGDLIFPHDFCVRAPAILFMGSRKQNLLPLSRNLMEKIPHLDPLASAPSGRPHRKIVFAAGKNIY